MIRQIAVCAAVFCATSLYSAAQTKADIRNGQVWVRISCGQTVFGSMAQPSEIPNTDSLRQRFPSMENRSPPRLLILLPPELRFISTTEPPNIPLRAPWYRILIFGYGFNSR